MRSSRDSPGLARRCCGMRASICSCRGSWRLRSSSPPCSSIT
jgi:hypothetical protein